MRMQDEACMYSGRLRVPFKKNILMQLLIENTITLFA